ncbi:glycosyltransferase [Rhodococcus sp. D2-41]|uniref:glycosyltransferase n=1 Tax=Speluncibacter jeojiensis TaxID=2710754 RepID=UPI002410B3E4|nr:glycosyltransferase [Rhodococcus sp. D2-41]MDG3009092.1 glycosyltransferase [Rhodococcus sp. D2-41]
MSETPHLVSVVIPAYNVRDVIDEQLGALAEQDYGGDFEVIVSDNGSTDGLREHLAGHPLRTALKLRCVDAARVRGASHARNVGAAAAEGDFLAFCDADDRVHSSWLRGLSEIGALTDAVSGPVETTSLNAPRIAESRPVRPPDEPYEFPGFLPFFLAGNCGIRRHAWERVGGYDESYTNGSEELDLAWRLQLAGYTIGHSPEAMLAYRLRDSYRAVWRQTVAYSVSQVRLTDEYRPYGLTKPYPLPLVLHAPILIVLLALRNPLLPRRLTQLPRGEWILNAAMLTGRIRGAITYRTWHA